MWKWIGYLLLLTALWWLYTSPAEFAVWLRSVIAFGWSFLAVLFGQLRTFLKAALSPS